MLPARMTRILVSGHKDRMEDVVDTLHRAGAVHLEDFQDDTGISSGGEPLPAGDLWTDLLLRVRGLQKVLETDDISPRTLATDNPASLVAEAESDVLPLIQQRAEILTRVSGLEAEQSLLLPFDDMEVDLGAVQTVESLRCFLGTMDGDPQAGLAAAGIESEFHEADTVLGRTVLVITRREDDKRAESILQTAGFSPAALPGGLDDTSDSHLFDLESSIFEANGELAAVDEALAAESSHWGQRLASLELHLSQEADMTQAPLRFGMTERTFHVEGWVPVARVGALQNALSSRYGNQLHFQDLGEAPTTHEAAPHGEDVHHEHEHEGHGHEDHASEPADEPPVQLVNKGPASKYEFMLGLLGGPRYWEIDPTKLMAFFFPIFFGLMVGDVLVGIIIIGVAMLLRKRHIFGIGGEGVAKPLMWGGIWAIIIGAFIFGEALGIHFVVDDMALEDGEKSWESIFGMHIDGEGFWQKSGGHEAAASGAHTITTHAESTSDSGGLAGMIKPHSDTHLSIGGAIPLGIYSKIHDVEALLFWSLVIGIVHLVLGLILGIRNVAVSHGPMLALQEKGSWLIMLGSVALIVVGVGGAAWALWLGLAFFLASVVLLWMGVQATIGVGFIAILEIPSLFGNLLSYTRLAAIGASKAGMALAFATIGFELVGGPAGWIIYLSAFVLIIALSILAGALQSLRLQFVEFFQKFYTGGGRSYEPFARRAA